MSVNVFFPHSFCYITCDNTINLESCLVSGIFSTNCWHAWADHVSSVSSPLEVKKRWEIWVGKCGNWKEPWMNEYWEGLSIYDWCLLFSTLLMKVTQFLYLACFVVYSSLWSHEWFIYFYPGKQIYPVEGHVCRYKKFILKVCYPKK